MIATLYGVNPTGVVIVNTRVREQLVPICSNVSMTYDYGALGPGLTNPRQAPSSGSALISSRSATMEDIVTPRYRQRQKAGEIINNPAQRSAVEIDCPIVHWDNHYTNSAIEIAGGGFHDYGTMGLEAMLSGTPLLEPPDFDLSVTISETCNAAVAGIAQSQAHLLETAAEFEKTVESYWSIIHDCTYLFRLAVDLKHTVAELKFLRLRYRRQKLAVIKRMIRELTEKGRRKYLEFRYGIRPVIYDMNNIVNALAIRPPERSTSRGFGSLVRESKDTYTDDLTFVSVRVVTQRSASVNATVRAGVLFDIPSCLTREIHNFGLDDLPETLWELVPFSFIVDWFYNVGNVIAACTPEIGVRELARFHTIWYEITQIQSAEAQPKPDYGSAPGKVHNVSGRGTYTRREIFWSRTPVCFASIPGGTSKVKLNSLKIADLVAIFRPFRS